MMTFPITAYGCLLQNFVKREVLITERTSKENGHLLKGIYYLI